MLTTMLTTGFASSDHGSAAIASHLTEALSRLQKQQTVMQMATAQLGKELKGLRSLMVVNGTSISASKFGTPTRGQHKAAELSHTHRCHAGTPPAGLHSASRRRREVDLALLHQASMPIQGHHKQNCSELLKVFHHAPPCSQDGRYLHITKAGGTEVERALKLPFQSHARLSHRAAGDNAHPQLAHCFAQGYAPYFALLRHPLERKLSLFAFWQSGERQGSYQSRQAAFCKPGTGRAHDIACVPKQPFSEWIRLGAQTNGQSQGDRQKPGDVDGVRLAAGDGMLYEMPNYMAYFLQPHKAGETPLEEIIALLSSRFFLVGVTDQLAAFVSLAQCSLPSSAHMRLSHGSRGESVRITNNSSHPLLDSLLDDRQYADAVRANLRDLYLYRWAEARFEALNRCMRQA